MRHINILRYNNFVIKYNAKGIIKNVETIYNVGVEVEKLRCTKEGKLSTRMHPEKFGNKKENDFITTDFGEAQIELRTPVCKSTEECYFKLETITNVVLDELNKNDELLWPYSMPCILPDNETDFNISNFGKYEEETNYRLALYEKYGYKMHCMSGVHVNFSFNKKFFEDIKKKYNNIPETTDEAYFKIMREFMKKAWILMYFMGATPLQLDCEQKRKISLRNGSRQGFGNGKHPLKIDLNDRMRYAKSIQENIDNGNILGTRELYTSIRAKSKGKRDAIEELLTEEIDHIEIRIYDLNPFDKCGISKTDLDFSIVFLFYCLLNEDEYTLDYKEVADNGLTEIQRIKLMQELEKMIEINNKLGLDCNMAIEEMINICKTEKTKSQKIEELARQKGLKESLLELAIKYAEDGEMNKYTIKQYPDLEASTVVVLKAAILRGINFKILDEAQSFIELLHEDHKEYVIQATKTNRDSYIFPYITGDKQFAKNIMRENGLVVSEGIMLNKNMDDKEINELMKPFYNRALVVKPRTTNCGVGITVFNEPVAEEQIKSAIKYAFQFGNDILVEHYVKGREYRFIVIDGKCESVIWRRSASVVGNGINTIRELIEMKNQEAWHLLLRHEVVIDEVAKEFLQSQGHDFEYIPKKHERIFLRENSNCSTGGESVGMTDKMPEMFKCVAEKAAKVFNAKICGVDIIIDDLLKEEYKIIEINENPGLSSSQWPYEGTGMDVGLKILKLLDFIE